MDGTADTCYAQLAGIPSSLRRPAVVNCHETFHVPGRSRRLFPYLVLLAPTPPATLAAAAAASDPDLINRDNLGPWSADATQGILCQSKAQVKAVAGSEGPALSQLISLMLDCPVMALPLFPLSASCAVTLRTTHPALRGKTRHGREHPRAGALPPAQPVPCAPVNPLRFAADASRRAQ